MATFIPPMKAISGDLPTGEGWATELKWDGMRLQAHIGQGRLRLLSISGRDVTSNFPELAPLAEAFGVDAVVDGEAVTFDGDRPSFARLQHRIHVAKPTPGLIDEYPIVFIAFDLLRLDDRDVTQIGFGDRRRLLEELLDDGPSWRVPPFIEGDGTPLLELARERDLEGVVAKRLSSTYQPGQRSRSWVKVKLRRRQEFVVGGWLPGSGGLDGSVGSLLVGVYDGDELLWAGAVGSGLRQHERDDLAERLVTVDACPFTAVPVTDRPATWVEPSEVVEVEYGSWTVGGQLWHPTFRGRRSDKDPREVIRELPPDAPGVVE